MTGILRIDRQLHADVYQALIYVEETELSRVGPDRLLPIASLASELRAALAELADDPTRDEAGENGRVSEARTLRNEAR